MPIQFFHHEVRNNVVHEPTLKRITIPSVVQPTTCVLLSREMTKQMKAHQICWFWWKGKCWVPGEKPVLEQGWGQRIWTHWFKSGNWSKTTLVLEDKWPNNWANFPSNMSQLCRSMLVFNWDKHQPSIGRLDLCTRVTNQHSHGPGNCFFKR